MLDHLSLLLVSILAGAIAAVSGFGIGSFVTPLLLLRFSAHEAVTLVALPHAWATGLRLVRLQASVHGSTFRQFGIASAVGGLAGALLQGQLGGLGLTLLLAVLLLTAGIGELRQRPVPLPDSSGWKLVGGTLSGFFGGLVGNQGGIRAVQHPHEVVRSRLTVCTGAGTTSRCPTYSSDLAAALQLMQGARPMIGLLDDPAHRRHANS